MRVCLQLFPLRPDLQALAMWFEESHDGQFECVTMLRAPAIAAALLGRPLMSGADVGTATIMLTPEEAPPLMIRVRQAAAETEAAWRHYDPAASIEVVEVSWVRAA